MSLRNILLRTINQKNKFVSLSAAILRTNHDHQWHREQETRQQYRYRTNIATVFLASVFFWNVEKDDKAIEETVVIDNDVAKKEQLEERISSEDEAGQKIPGLPTYTADEVSKHDKRESFWVTYKHGVYDVTSFIPSHPGGNQILNAGGLGIEPFWNVYGMHKTKAIYTLLESYRIGNLHDDDVVEHSGEELWAMEPSRDERLIVKTRQPFNAETPAKLMIQNFDTPNELFYVRQHMPVPELEAKSHKLRITINDGRPRSKDFDLQELVEKFPPAQVSAALMCAGNRRSEMNKVRPVKGIAWQQGAICNAQWRGVALRDVLLHCGVDAADTAGKHVIFTGSDIDATGTNFSTSIPLDQALNPNGKVLLVTHMNGEVLPKDHGYPLRVVVPGAPAFRSVKWLESITVSFDESSSHWHQKDYRSFNASKTWETADFASAPPVYSVPVTSAICEPADGDACRPRAGVLEVKGYAYSGGGAKILRVDVSADGGETWLQADELLCDRAPPAQHYAWALWCVRVPVREGQAEMEIWAKATDSNFNTQPERFTDIWNIRGILSNAYHRIKVKIKQ